MAYQVEVTDTFGREANYSWVRRYRIELPINASKRSLVIKAKSVAGWRGLKCDTSDMGDLVELRPRGMCQVMFISWIDHEPDAEE